MLQTISINLSHSEFTNLINNAVTTAIDNRLKPSEQDELLTIEQAKEYLKCSAVLRLIEAIKAARLLYRK